MFLYHVSVRICTVSFSERYCLQICNKTFPNIFIQHVFFNYSDFAEKKSTIHTKCNQLTLNSSNYKGGKDFRSYLYSIMETLWCGVSYS